MEMNIGERIPTPDGKKFVIRRRPSEENKNSEEKDPISEEKGETPKFDVKLDRSTDRMIVLPKGSSPEEYDEARAILKKLEEEKEDFYKRRATEGKFH